MTARTEVSRLALADKDKVRDVTDAESKSLNFKVSDDFKREFKGFAVAHGITMTDLLKEGFELVKMRHKGA